MTPILFNATTKVNTSEGLGRLTDAISCVVTEERNGSYELTMTYPVTGQHYEDIEIRYQIVTSAFKGSGKQAFRIYKISKPLNGIVTINARHISYDLKNIVVSPFTASGCAQALTNLKAAIQVTNDFTFWTNKSVAANFQLKHPDTVRNVLGGSAGSLLDVYGTGEYEFDNYDVKLWLHRGSDKGVTIRYGKNLTDVKATMDSGNVYTTIVPYWVSQDGATVVNGDPVYSEHETEVPGHSTVAMDFSSEFTEAPTKAALMAKAAQYLEANRPWEISENLTISFVALADTEEYKDVASLETVNLCDTVHVFHPKLGITATAKVVRTKWDSLRERYDEIELGTPKTTLSQAIAPVTKTDLTRQATQTSNFLLDSMAELIEALTGASGGHVIFHREADGHISEIYIMDTDDAATATNVLRINYLGIYASTTGINGTYNLAITTGGTINANQILAGTLQGIAIIAETGDIGGWEITANGLQKDIVLDGVRYRVVMRPPNTTSGVETWIVSSQFYDETNQVWRSKAFISASGKGYFFGGLTVYDEEKHYGAETHSGAVTFSNTETHSGAETHSGTETHSGAFTYSGTLTGNGVATFTKNVHLDGYTYFGSTDNAARWVYLYGYLLLGSKNGIKARIYAPTTNELYIMTNSDDQSSYLKLAYYGSSWSLYPQVDGAVRFGQAAHRWTDIYATNGTIQTSDRRQKKDIKPIDGSLIDKLKPVSYVRIDGKRTHYGLVAQDVEEALDGQDFAGLIKSPRYETEVVEEVIENPDGTVETIKNERETDKQAVDEDGNPIFDYGLRYEEFIAPLIAKVQELQKRIEELERKIGG